ncbi:MAG: multicopper oxidase domain-containing protein [Nitrospirae bacterium]|nr:multicopper oxidase domain-containing protein [Nitrospirota bacterium]MBI5694650.1 multicopper oxidase domain-containing protein [Nitrospirota bacterium]
MNKTALWFIRGAVFCALMYAVPSMAIVDTYCPSDLNGDGISDDPDVVCRHITGGDGFAKMADGKDLYVFGFGDATGVPDGEVMMTNMLGANTPAPTIVVKEGQEVYLTLSNVGMANRPDLFDAHSVHWHGFPNASVYYDGVPDASVAINMGASLWYYYKAMDPGTYMYHCHVEVVEHMEMGMVGNLFVTPLQDGTAFDDPTDSVVKNFTKFAYNDGDGTTGYDVDKLIQLGDFDSRFHDASISVQPLPFDTLDGDYHLINGRGYPDTINPDPIVNVDGNPYQPEDSLVTVTQGQRVLLRVSNLSATEYHTLRSLGIPMKVIGRDARILRTGGDPAGTDLYYYTSSVTLGGGQSYDVLLDTTGVAPGTYFLYSRNLNDLNNKDERRGGMMTQIVVQ